MRLSLKRLSLLRLAASLLALAAFAVCAWLVQARTVADLAAEREQRAARDAARHIELRLGHDHELLGRFARLPGVVSAMAVGRDEQRERLAQSLGGALPGTMDLDLISFEAGPSEGPRAALLDARCRALLAGAPARAAIALHLPQETPAHFALLQPVIDSGVVRGAVFARLSADWVRDTVASALPSGGYVELLTARGRGASGLAVAGEAARRAHGEPITAPVRGAGFVVGFWPPADSGAVPSPWNFVLPGAAVIALALLAAVTLLVDARMRRAVRRDMKSARRMVKDIHDGVLRVDYPVELAEFRTLFSFLGRSGGRLVRERRHLKDLGLTDHLTRLPNRRAFEMKLEQMHVQSRGGFPSSLLLIDIDRFKQINDRHGHDAGDAFIAGFARALRNCVRASDFVARLAGDEFCILFPFTDQHTAEVLAERLRLRMPAEIDLGNGSEQPVGWTGGLSVMHRFDTKFDDVVWRADKALFEAKAAGRNRTYVHQPDMPATRFA